MIASNPYITMLSISRGGARSLPLDTRNNLNMIMTNPSGIMSVAWIPAASKQKKKTNQKHMSTKEKKMANSSETGVLGIAFSVRDSLLLGNRADRPLPCVVKNKLRPLMRNAETYEIQKSRNVPSVVCREERKGNETVEMIVKRKMAAESSL